MSSTEAGKDKKEETPKAQKKVVLPAEEPEKEKGQGQGKPPEGRRKSSWGAFSRVVIVAIDPSPGAKMAFDWYLKNVWQKDDLVVLTYVPDSPKLASFGIKSGLGVPVVEWKGTLDKMNSKIKKLEEDFEAECVQKKIKYKMRGEVFKNTGEGIVSIADDENADLIVIGSRGMNAVKRAVIGSVSDYVVRNSHIPCLVVRAKKLTA